MLNELALRIEDDAAGEAAERLDRDAGAAARLLDEWNMRLVLRENERARGRSGSGRVRGGMRRRWTALLITQCAPADAALYEIIARSLVHRDEAANLRQEQRLAHRIADRLAQLQRRHVAGKRTMLSMIVGVWLP